MWLTISRDPDNVGLTFNSQQCIAANGFSRESLYNSDAIWVEKIIIIKIFRRHKKAYS